MQKKRLSPPRQPLVLTGAVSPAFLPRPAPNLVQYLSGEQASHVLVPPFSR